MTTAQNEGGAQPSTLSKFTPAQLYYRRQHLVAQRDEIAGQIANVDAEVRARFTPAFVDLLKQQGKDAGSLTFERDGLKLKGEVRKSVKWDSKKLQAIASGMDWPTVSKLFKIEFSVPEATYKALLDEELRRLIDAARTVTLSEPTVAATEIAGE